MKISFLYVSLISILGISLSGCSIFPEDVTEQIAQEVVETAENVSNKGKKTMQEVQENVDGIAGNVQKKMEEIERAIIKIEEAKEAIFYVFSGAIPSDLFFCENDSQCIVVDYKGCCTQKIAIQKDYFDQYTKTKNWQGDTISCTNILCNDSAHLVLPRCIPDASGIKRCTLTSQ
jgi:hypothetical protein